MKDTRTLGDAAYRYGGEEFLIVLLEQTMESGVTVAERLRQAIERLKIPHGARKPPEILTISAGVAAVAREGRKTFETLLKQADEALYAAKKAGRNCVVPRPEAGE